MARWQAPADSSWLPSSWYWLSSMGAYPLSSCSTGGGPGSSRGLAASLVVVGSGTAVLAFAAERAGRLRRSALGFVFLASPAVGFAAFFDFEKDAAEDVYLAVASLVWLGPLLLLSFLRARARASPVRAAPTAVDTGVLSAALGYAAWVFVVLFFVVPSLQ